MEQRKPTLFFTTEDNRLTRYDERQRDFDFADRTPVRVIEMRPTAAEEA